MASHTPMVIRNEKLTTNRGKGVLGVKGDLSKDSKPARTVRKDRKALRDISNVGNPPVPGASKGSTLKQKPTVRGRSTTKNVLTEEDILKCHEWAKDGIEDAYFTGNDLQYHLQDVEEKRVRNEVGKVMSALHEWSNVSYELGMPVKKSAHETEDLTKLEFEPEVLPLMTRLRSASGNDDTEDLLCGHELYDLPSLDYTLDTLKLKEDYGAGVNPI